MSILFFNKFLMGYPGVGSGILWWDDIPHGSEGQTNIVIFLEFNPINPCKFRIRHNMDWGDYIIIHCSVNLQCPICSSSPIYGDFHSVSSHQSKKNPKNKTSSQLTIQWVDLRENLQETIDFPMGVSAKKTHLPNSPWIFSIRNHHGIPRKIPVTVNQTPAPASRSWGILQRLLWRRPSMFLGWCKKKHPICWYIMEHNKIWITYLLMFFFKHPMKNMDIIWIIISVDIDFGDVKKIVGPRLGLKVPEITPSDEKETVPRYVTTAALSWLGRSHTLWQTFT